MKLSIVTINYNNANGLESTINSVLNQQECNFEYIVIDGLSTDSSVEIIKNVKHNKNISFKWISEKDTGVYNAMNKGVKMSTGEYLLFLNSGDIFYSSNVIREFYNFESLEDIIVGKLMIKTSDVIDENYIKEIPDELTANYLFNDYLPHPATFIKKKIFEKLGLYNERNKIVSDWEFFAKALLVYNFSYKKINLLVSCFVPNGLSSLPENAKLIEMEKRRFLKKQFPRFLKDDENYNLLKKEKLIYSESMEKKIFDFLKKIRFIAMISFFYKLSINVGKFFK